MNIAFIIVVIIISTFIYFNQDEFSRKYSKIDDKYGNLWRVISKYKNKDDAVKLISNVDNKIRKLIVHLNNKYPNDEITQLVNDRYRSRRIYENDPADGDGTSYTISKGKQIKLCVRSKREPDRLIDENTLTFVAIHELSHLANSAYGHEDDFWNIFRFLLRESVNIGIYEPVDYKLYPQRYCGIIIDYQPLYD